MCIAEDVIGSCENLILSRKKWNQIFCYLIDELFELEVEVGWKMWNSSRLMIYF